MESTTGTHRGDLLVRLDVLSQSGEYESRLRCRHLSGQAQARQLVGEVHTRQRRTLQTLSERLSPRRRDDLVSPDLARPRANRKHAETVSLCLTSWCNR